MSNKAMEGQRQWDAFLAEWPVSRLRDLSLDEYYGPEGDKSFFSWIRDHTNQLGEFREGPLGAGVRSRVNSAANQPGSGMQVDDHYIWYSILGSSAAEAFENLKRELIVAIEAVRSGDLRSIGALKRAPGALVWKVAFLYQDQNKPLLLPFYTAKQLKKVVPDLAGNKTLLQQELMARRGDEALLEYADRLWVKANEYVLPPDEVQEILARFASDPRLANSLHSDEARWLFCHLARAVHQQGWDWWTVNLDQAGSIRFGRRNPLEKRATAVLGQMNPRQDGLYVCLNTRLADTDGWQPMSGTLVAQVEQEDFAAECYAEHSVDRPGRWPTDYQDNSGKPVDETQESEESARVSIGQPALNQILYGPPGTGKTYATIDAALEILDPEYLKAHREDRTTLKARFDELAAAGQVRFITFHQSFSYEDFVEGLRAVTDEDTGQIRYEVMDGVFKSLCEAAAVKVTQQADAPIDLGGRRIWKMSLGNTLGSDASIYEECIAGGYILLGYGGAIDFSGCHSREDVHQRFVASGHALANPNTDYGLTSVTAFVTRMKAGDLVVVSDGNFKFRAIGEITGDYAYRPHKDFVEDYSQSRPVKWLRTYEPSLPHGELMNNQFSQMTLYELRPGMAVDMAKLALLLNRESTHADSAQGAVCFSVGERFGSGYRVVKASADLLELEKPNGKSLPIGMSLLNTLVDYVRQGLLSLEDIRDKRVFEKAPTTLLEPYLVNGYNNILPSLVERLLNMPAKPADCSSRVFANDARVLIIDEINRGNVSRIFGELITLIEPSKREGAEEALSAELPYSKRPFSVPANVYLIGTMNTADRSLAGLDIALRRRFTFKEMPPRPELLDKVVVAGVNIGQLLRVMNQRIEVLLDRDHCLGHAYFMPLRQDPSLSRLESIFRNQVLPLLQEYFFEDWQRIQWVLNDHRKAALDRFVSQRQNDVQVLFGNGVEVSAHNLPWSINEDAFQRVTAYAGIVSVQAKLETPAEVLEAAEA